MAQVNAGRVRFIGRGEYDNSTQYYTFDLVNYNGNSYFAKSNTMGNLPTNSTYWQLVAEKGNIGPAGPTGNGIDHISLTSQSGATKVYTIYYTDGTTSEYTVQDGEVTQEVFDEEVERLKMVYNAMPKVSGEGTDLTLNNTAECPVYDVELSPSELEQETTSISEGDEYDSPSPEHPQEIHTISGENIIVVENKNLLSLPDLIYGGGSNLSYNITDETITLTQTGSSAYSYKKFMMNLDINKYKGKTLHFNCKVDNNSSRGFIGLYDENKSGIGNLQASSITIPSDTTATYIGIQLYQSYSTGVSGSVTFSDLIITLSSNTDYIEHKSQSLPLSLGNLEYCKIGDYEDLFFKNVVGSEYYDSTLELDKWYLKKRIGKIDLGTLTWISENEYSLGQFRNNSNLWSNIPLINGGLKCPIFIYQEGTVAYNTLEEGKMAITNSQTSPMLRVKSSKYSTYSANEFKTAMNGKYLYYQMYTSTYTLLSDTLQTQLDNIQKAITYQDQTNVSQTNNDLPFVIKLSAIRDLSGIFEEI